MPLNPNQSESRDMDYELPEEAMYMGRLARVIELGEQTDKYGTKPRVVFGFTVPELTINIDGVEKQRLFWSYPQNATQNPETTAAKWMRAINPEAQSYQDCLGMPCGIEFKHKAKEGVTYANIANISRPMRGVEVPEPDCDTYVFDFTYPNKEVWDKLSERRQETIKNADNYEGSPVQKMLDGTSTDQQPTDTNAYESEDSPI